VSGDGAAEFARDRGLEFAPLDYFITEARRQEWLAARGDISPLPHPLPGVGTVGAVALDTQGNVAAATSTGGMVLKRWGRIGDSPVIGAGTYADNRAAAVSATGHGEMFLRAVAAHDVCARVRYLGQTLVAASREVLAEIARLGGTGGLIALDARGEVVMEFNSDGMYRGCIGIDGQLRTHIWD
jgi:beta-aspartyl-peptidase (threonine type)